MVDAPGTPVACHLTGGQAAALAGADALPAGTAAPVVLADRGDAAEARVLAPLREAGEAAASPPKRSRRGQRACDRDLYGARHPSENSSCRRKQYRGIATRDDTTKRNFLAGVHLAATAILLNCGHALANLSSLSGEIFNVGGGADHSLSLRETTALCREITGKAIPIQHREDNRPADLKLYITDNRRVTAATGWQPRRCPRTTLTAIHDWIEAEEARVRHLWLG